MQLVGGGVADVVQLVGGGVDHLGGSVLDPRRERLVEPLEQLQGRQPLVVVGLAEGRVGVLDDLPLILNAAHLIRVGVRVRGKGSGSGVGLGPSMRVH